MGVPPVQKGRAGRPSHKKYQIVSYTNFKKECNSILVPPPLQGGARGGLRVLHDFREMVLFNSHSLVKNLNKNLTIFKYLHKYQYFLKKFLACNQISSTGFCWSALGANKIQVIDQFSGSLSPFSSNKKSLNSPY